MSLYSITPIQEADRPWLRQFLTERWGSPLLVSRGQAHHGAELPGFIARAADGQPLGLATYHLARGALFPLECELVSLDSLVEGQGIGSALIEVVRHAAEEAGCQRLWLITTNDNLPALRFYQRRGFRLVAVHAGAVAQSRRLKPSIPEIGLDCIPLRDEIELDSTLMASSPTLPKAGAGVDDRLPNPAGTRLARRTIYESRWVNLYLDHMRTPSGLEITDYHIVDYPNDAVAAYVTNSKGEILMGQYYRYAISQLRWEIPAGGVEPDEDPLEAAQREVLAETGST